MKHKKKILITGGSRGLGLALAKRYDELGADVSVTARDASQLASALEGTNIRGIVSDISEKRSIYPLAARVVDDMGGLDILINNAGYLGVTPLRLLADTDCEDLNALWTTNVLGPFRLIKALLPTLEKSPEGLVVNISSDAAVSAYETWGGYSISKAALDHMTRLFQQEHKRTSLKFIAVDPGDMLTDMYRAAIPDADTSQLRRPEQVADELERFLSQQAFPEIRCGSQQWRELL